MCLQPTYNELLKHPLPFFKIQIIPQRMNQIKHTLNFTYFFIYLLYSENGRGLFLYFTAVTSMCTRWKWLIPDDASGGVISATPIASGRGDADFIVYNFFVKNFITRIYDCSNCWNFNAELIKWIIITNCSIISQQNPKGVLWNSN